MHRVVGDRTRALGGALTVAGLCWDLTNFATTRRGVARYHGGHVNGRCVRWRAALLALAPWGALAPVLGAAFASAAHAAATRFDGPSSAFAWDRPGARFARPRPPSRMRPIDKSRIR